MEILHKNPIINRIINEQFRRIGYDNIKYEDLPEDGILEFKKKKIKWWEYYLFKDEEQYISWKEWAINLMKEHNIPPNKFPIIDMTYGLNYKLPQTQKEGQMKLF